MSRDFFPELAAQGNLPRVPLVRGILFDFDYTLAYRTRPLDELLEEGAHNAEAYMRAQGMDLPPHFWRNIIEARRFAEKKSDDEREEHIADDAMSFLLQFFGYPIGELDRTILHQTVDMFYAPEMTAWQLYPHARETLSALNAAGYRLAVVANYSCDRVFQRTIDYLNLRSYLDMCITSASVEYRKPDPTLFDIAAQRWDALPYELVVVGDSLAHDVAGAIKLGALAVQAQLKPGMEASRDRSRSASAIAPDAVIDSLSQLPELIAKWTTT